MLRLKSIGIAVAIICSLLLISIVNSSKADIEIVEMSASGYTSSDGGTSLSVSVETNEPYDQIDIYFGEELIGQTFSGNEVKTSAHFNLWHNLNDGTVKGREYEIRAEAWRENDGDPSEDTESYYLTLYQPVVTSGIGENTGVYGYAEVSAHYFDGSSFVMSASASAYNGTNIELDAAAWFRQQKFTTLANGPGAQEWIKRDPPLDQPIVFDDLPSGDTHSDSVDSMVVEYSLGRQIGDEEVLYFDAHTHLQVNGEIAGQHEEDHWEADTGVQEFTDVDNP